MSVESFHAEVETGQRFEFGKNWQHFLQVLNEDRIAEAKSSLKNMLGVDSLAGKTFVDIGSGSGLFSLAAMLLEAERVHSLDYDPHSVACTGELKARYFRDCSRWSIEQGSALDSSRLQQLGRWDVVYSWGVLHHTGRMWEALENVVQLVNPRGQLFISVYNDQGFRSGGWRAVKFLYNKSVITRAIISGVFVPYFVMKGLGLDLLLRKNPLLRYTEYRKKRGMSCVYDWFDWLGGYPFEVAKPEAIFDFYRLRGFSLERLRTCGGAHGVNEFVFRLQDI